MIPNSLFPLVCALLANVTAQVAKLFIYYSGPANGTCSGSS